MMQSRPWSWIPSLYLMQAVPYMVVMTLSTTLYKNLGVSNTVVALYTSLAYLPWVIKPLWSPLIELLGTKRRWIWVLQLVVGALLVCLALSLPLPSFFGLSIGVLWAMAFVSASHDIAADGFYMLALPTHEQAAFVGVRSAFYRIANILGQGGLTALSGWLMTRYGAVQAWQAVMALLGILFTLGALYHMAWLPKPSTDAPQKVGGTAEFLRESWIIFLDFFNKPAIWVTVGFLLLYRFPEAQLLKLATPFLLDPAAAGGLALSNEQVGFAYGTVGIAALTCGGLLGGWLVSRVGLGKALWPMILAMHVPNIMFLLLALYQPSSIWVVSAALAIEQFGYGLGFTAYLMVMIHVADGPHKTAHYAVCTGFMALGMMIPGMWSGWLQDQVGYVNFFIWVLVATLPSFVMTALIKVPAGFGMKAAA
jgi:MFS transporter, PAT family, beta-lactamase induction signal transducer AmpG